MAKFLSVAVIVGIATVPSPVASWSSVRPALSPRWTPRLFSQRDTSQLHSLTGFKLYASIDFDKVLPDSPEVHSSSVDVFNPMHTTNVDPDYADLTQKLINGLLLVVTLGYAAYTVLNIDHGMTRGWTQSEIAMRIPLDNWSSYETSLAEKPIYTKTLINVVIYLLGDWLSQTLFQKKNALDFDPMRVLRNGFIGLCFGPLVHEYYQFSDHILPLETGGLLTRLEKITMDQTIYLTVKCSIYIMAVGLLQGDSFEDSKQNVKDRIQGIVFTAWKFWPLVHCVTYSLIPARHRILWVNCVDLVWNAILATIARKPAEELLVPDEAPDEREVFAKMEETLSETLHMQSEDIDLADVSFLLQEESEGVLVGSPNSTVAFST